MEKRHPRYGVTIMLYHSSGVLICDGPVVSTTLPKAQNLGKYKLPFVTDTYGLNCVQHDTNYSAVPSMYKTRSTP